jgi:hypothetical protein
MPSGRPSSWETSSIAVIGNHELNAIAWHTPDPCLPREYLRSHHSEKWGDKNRNQHAAFLAEVEDKPARHAEAIDWFLTLPLWLDLPQLRWCMPVGTRDSWLGSRPIFIRADTSRGT